LKTSFCLLLIDTDCDTHNLIVDHNFTPSVGTLMKLAMLYAEQGLLPPQEHTKTNKAKHYLL